MSPAEIRKRGNARDTAVVRIVAHDIARHSHCRAGPAVVNRVGFRRAYGGRTDLDRDGVSCERLRVDGPKYCNYASKYAGHLPVAHLERTDRSVKHVGEEVPVWSKP